MVIETFHPFMVNNDWYALYSSDYTATRVAKLEQDKFVDWCGKRGDSFGFCPAEFYVPRYHKIQSSYTNQKGEAVHFEYEEFDNEHKPTKFEQIKSTDGYMNTHYLPYGFVCGCVWGDDTSWKLRFIDLSKNSRKTITY